jgi:D-glycero-beta-D-manno-heptose 1-phosphate adenylyltransferase
MISKKIQQLDHLVPIIEKKRREGKTVVLANGAFDIIHVGHIRYLVDAKSRGDVLIVALNDDESVFSLKGPGRPLTPLVERLEILAALEAVDYLTWFGGPQVTPVLRALRPRYHAKGTDYTPENLPEMDINSELGIELIICGDPKDHSSTSLIELLSKGEAS